MTTMSLSEIVLDTDLDPQRGNRLAEVGCVELVDQSPHGGPFSATHRSRGRYSDRGDLDSQVGHGFLSKRPAFADIVVDPRSSIGDSKLNWTVVSQ